jgi:hypothetical protein
MTRSLDEYNAGVEQAWRDEGMRSTREPMGSRLQPGAWNGAEVRAGLTER